MTNEDVNRHFFRYVQMYEFEGLLFSDPVKLAAGLYIQHLENDFVAIRKLETLRRRHGNDARIKSWMDGKRKIVKAAALLHDLGHGPFSPMIERAFGAHDRHEEASKRMIDDTDFGVFKALNRHMGANEIQEFKNLLDFHEHPFRQAIVSGGLDADRMDYLLRGPILSKSPMGATISCGS